MDRSCSSRRRKKERETQIEAVTTTNMAEKEEIRLILCSDQLCKVGTSYFLSNNVVFVRSEPCFQGRLKCPVGQSNFSVILTFMSKLISLKILYKYHNRVFLG